MVFYRLQIVLLSSHVNNVSQTVSMIKLFTVHGHNFLLEITTINANSVESMLKFQPYLKRPLSSNYFNRFYCELIISCFVYEQTGK